MTVINVKKINEVFMLIDCEKSIRREIYDLFSFQIDNAQYNPLVKNGSWDGYIRLFNYKMGTLYSGLIKELIDWADAMEYSIDVDPELIEQDDITREELKTFVDSLNLPFEEHDYQFDTIYNCIKNKRHLYVSPTGSGKSLNSYVLSRYYHSLGKKSLIIVPTIMLVKQFVKDFEEYGNEGMTTQSILEGASKVIVADVTVSTWQSIKNQKHEWFENFDVVIGDECHKFQAKSLTNIMENCRDIKYRFGFTGSLQDSKVNKLTLTGLFGPVEIAATTKELQDRGILAYLKIKAIILKYNRDQIDEFKEALKVKKTKPKDKTPKFKKETDWVYSNPERDEFIVKLSHKCTENTLILFRYTDHGKRIFEKIKNSTNRPVFFVNGEMKSPEEREAVRQYVINNEGCIVVASVGVFSTGINIPNIYNIIFISPFKAKIEILQSIGRGLRVTDTKKSCNLYDIVDDLRYSSTTNYLMEHFVERIELYKREEFNYRLHQYNL